jgi:eukaryotic-like serine/threonine-protein kinase
MAPMAVETDILPPRYRGPQPIGHGGMGDIYRATDATLGRAVAVKLLSARYAEDEAIRERFTREALAAARLSGEPNIVTIFDVGDWHNRPFIVMEYFGGGSLDDKVRATGAQPPAQALDWLEQAARALDAAHAHGVVHRDVKPANLLLDREGKVHVADFGIASAAGLDSLTMTGTVLGTAGYLSPEQAQGDRATPASDRYSLGVVAFELLTGTRPFESESVTAEAAAHVHAQVPSICERDSSLPCELDPVFAHALAKEPNARFDSCADFVADLRAALQQAVGDTRVLAPRPPPLQRAPHRSRFPLVAVLASLAIVAAGILAAVLLTRGGSSAEQRTFVRTVVKTGPGRTVKQRVTVTAATPPPAVSTVPLTASSGGSIGEGIRLTDQATALMKSGDYNGALRLAQQALAILNGTGQTYEAYASFDAGNSLAHLGRCDEAKPYLDTRERLLGPHPGVDAARRLCGG